VTLQMIAIHHIKETTPRPVPKSGSKDLLAVLEQSPPARIALRANPKSI
jgi:hypothetical protein